MCSTEFNAVLEQEEEIVDPTGLLERVARDDELLSCLGSGRPVPEGLDTATWRVAALLRAWRAAISAGLDPVRCRAAGGDGGGR